MDYFSDPQETVTRFGDYIEDFHDVFRCNDVDFGLPADFFTFARRLNHDSELRGDVLRVVKTVMEGEADISFRTILTIIAVGSGGPDVTASKGQMSVPVNLIIEALTGGDARSELNAAQSGDSYSEPVEDRRAIPAVVPIPAVAQIPVAEEIPAAEEILAMAQIPAVEEIPAMAQIPVEAKIPTAAQIPAMAQISAAFDGYSWGAGDAIDRAELEEPCFEEIANVAVGDLSDRKIASIDENLSSVYGGKQILTEILTRLKSNALRVKVFLESIEQKFSRMETRLTAVLPTLALSGPTVRPSGDEGAARFYSAIAAGARPELPDHDPARPNQQSRSVAESLATVARLWTDVRQFYSSRRQVEVSVLSFAATLVLIGSLVWSIGRFTGHAVVHPVNASVEGVAKPAAVSAAPLAASSASDTLVARAGEAQSALIADSPVPVVTKARADRVDGSSVVAVGTAQGSSAPTNSYAGRGVRPPAAKDIQPSKKPAQSFKSPSLSTSSPIEGASREMTADTSEGTATPDHSYSVSSESSSKRLINVSSGVMAANLVSSPKPSYPKLASLIRAQGNVLLQAVISKTGTVEHLHVIKGHRLLRGAAKSAVQMWRYRPYKINGVPVEVATIVSVEFTLNR